MDYPFKDTQHNYKQPTTSRLTGLEFNSYVIKAVIFANPVNVIPDNILFF